MDTTHILWDAAGQSGGNGNKTGICRICGQEDIGLSFNDWVRGTFNDWDKILSGEIICHVCQFAFAESSKFLAAHVGKEKPQRMRNYSHFVVDGTWIPVSKANKSQMANILLNRSPSLAVIAISGQKHIIFRAQPGRWQIEEKSVLPFSDDLRDILQIVEELYSVFSKAEIDTAKYRHYKILDFGLVRWAELEKQINTKRGGVQFKLALFLAQKGEELNDGDARKGSGIVDGDLARDSERVQESLSAHNMAAVRGQRKVGSVHQQPGQVRQLSLFQVASTD